MIEQRLGACRAIHRSGALAETMERCAPRVFLPNKANDERKELRCWQGKGNIKVISAKQTQFFLKLKKPKHIYPP